MFLQKNDSGLFLSNTPLLTHYSVIQGNELILPAL